MFCTKEGTQSLSISVKNHDTQQKKVNLSIRLQHYMANSSFSNMSNHKATKVPYSYLQKCLESKDILLKLLSYS